HGDVVDGDHGCFREEWVRPPSARAEFSCVPGGAEASRNKERSQGSANNSPFFEELEAQAGTNNVTRTFSDLFLPPTQEQSQLMLQSLRIQNLALIDDAQIHFGEGLTVFTGESGSGKSTVLDALALLRGAARPRIQIRKASKSGLVEAEFRLLRDKNGDILNQALCGALDEAGLLSAIDLGEPLVLARRIEATGRTRSFIQGQTVPRTVLAAVASELLDLTGQAEAHRLRTTGAQLLALDQ